MIFLAFNLTHVGFIMLINVKMPTIVMIYEHDNFILSWVEHEKSFITLGVGSFAQAPRPPYKCVIIKNCFLNQNIMLWVHSKHI